MTPGTEHRTEPGAEQANTPSDRRDYLWLNLSTLPYFRALMRSVEASFYRDIELTSPVLDIGCGDGHFASVAFRQRLDTGIDPWEAPIREAIQWDAYNSLVQGDAGVMPFPAEYFASAVSNSVLEHIPHLEKVLMDTARVLKPGALFVFCVPNDRFLASLSIGRSLDRLGLTPLGNSYRAFFNRISRHYHCDDPQVWEERLERCGFEIETYWHYYQPEAMRVSEWGHYLGSPALVTRKLTGKWILFPTRRNPFMRFLESKLRPYYEREVPDREIGEHFYSLRDDLHREIEPGEGGDGEGVCTFYITRKKT